MSKDPELTALAIEARKKLDLVRIFAEEVVEEMKLSDGGDAYAYTGSTNTIETLRECISEYHLVRDRMEYAKMRKRGEL